MTCVPLLEQKCQTQGVEDMHYIGEDMSALANIVKLSSISSTYYLAKSLAGNTNQSYCSDCEATSVPYAQFLCW